MVLFKVLPSADFNELIHIMIKIRYVYLVKRIGCDPKEKTKHTTPRGHPKSQHNFIGLNTNHTNGGHLAIDLSGDDPNDVETVFEKFNAKTVPRKPILRVQS